MYTKSAQLYDELYHFKDYSAAATELRAVLQKLYPNARSLLDVGCSTGRHLMHLRHELEVEGLDINGDLLAIARARLPGVTLHQGDMTNFDLGRTFDVVTCLFASIAYVCTIDRLNRAVEMLAKHVVLGGLLFIEPWISPTDYWRKNVVMNTSERPERKMVWMYVGEEKDNIVTNHIRFLVGTPEGVSHFSEVHRMGLFQHQDYLTALAAAGMTLLSYDSSGFFGNGLYIARRTT